MNIFLNNSYVNLVRENRDFRYLWFSQIISLMGDWFNLIASATLVANLSSSGLAIGGLFLARLLPPFLLGPVVGVVADRFDRRKILIISDVLRSVVVLNFLFIKNEQDVWVGGNAAHYPGRHFYENIGHGYNLGLFLITFANACASSSLGACLCF